MLAHVLRREPEERRWNKELIENVVGVPWKLKPDEERRERMSSRALAEDEIVRPVVVQPPAEVVPRRMMLRRGDFERHGYTAGCPGCLHYQIEGSARAGHTEECRKRIEEAIAASDDGATRVEQSRSKMSRYADADNGLDQDAKDENNNKDESGMDADTPPNPRGR